MNVDIVVTGNCMICGKPIEIVPVRGSCKFTDVFLCRECEKEVMNSRKDRSPIKEEKNE